MSVFDGMGWVEISVSQEDIMKDGEKIGKSIMENAVYEVTEDLMTGTYTIRMGNPVLSCSAMGVKELEGDKE